MYINNRNTSSLARARTEICYKPDKEARKSESTQQS